MRAGFAGQSELGAAFGKFRGALGWVLVLSAGLNLLTLSGSLYLMLVYDRVLPSQSLPTLFSLFLIVSVAYAFQGAFDVLRTQMLADIAALLDRRLTRRVQAVEMRLALERPETRDQLSPSRDLDQLRGFIASPGLPALMDLPWVVFFLLILALVHYWLGVVTLAGVIVVAFLTWRAERVSKRHVAAVTEAGTRRRALADRQWRHAELVTSMGMRSRFAGQLETAHHKFLDEQATLTDATARLSAISKVFRMFLQSAVLTVGAILVIDGKATGGIIFASSILSARALAPVDQVIANWRGFVGARQSWARLNDLFKQVPAEPSIATELPPPALSLAVDRIALTPPGSQRPAVTDASFSLVAGQALGIIGASASGKSSLARGIVGAWKPVRGTIRLDGATIDQWDSQMLGAHLGYLPQSVELFAGTVAQNIARFEPDAPSEPIIAAATAAGVHALILQLPGGYDCPVGEDGGNLSAGQRQRIALARALYRDPFLVVLDEPNSNLDPDGEAALARAIEGVKARQGIIVLIAHRALVLGTVDLLLVMHNGAVQAFGPRDEVLAKIDQARRDQGGLTIVGNRG